MGGPIQNEQLAKMSLAIARFFVGQKERTGNNDGAFVNTIQEWYAGRGEYGAPWCALFATFCIYLAAYILGIKPILPKSDSSTDLYLFAKKNGLLLDYPVMGCLALQKGSGGTPGKLAHHTNRVTGIIESQQLFYSLDGNKSNQVMSGIQNKIDDYYFVSVC